MEPLSGQFALNFETRELDEKVRVIAERSADDWLAVALEYEAQSLAPRHFYRFEIQVGDRRAP